MIFSPAASETIHGLNKYNPDAEFQCQLQIGSKLFPEYPMRSHQEAFYQLRKTLGHQSSSTTSFITKGYEYKSIKFVSAIDTEKVIEAGFSGLNTRASDLLTVKFKYNAVAAVRQANLMHIVLHFDHMLEIHDTGVRVF